MIDLHLKSCVDHMAIMPESETELILADPPYGIGVRGLAWDTLPDYVEFSRRWLEQAHRVLRPGGALLVWGSPKELYLDRLKLLACDAIGFHFVQELSWVYRQGGDSRLSTMRDNSTRHERLAWLEKPGGPRTFRPLRITEPYGADEMTAALAKGVGRVSRAGLENGKPPRSWVDVPRVNSRSIERRHGSHPCMKPLVLCERLVLAHSDEGHAVLVPFAGSGSECIAAASLGRRVTACETEEAYADILKKRCHDRGLVVRHLA